MGRSDHGVGADRREDMHVVKGSKGAISRGSSVDPANIEAEPAGSGEGSLRLAGRRSAPRHSRRSGSGFV
jgi:hypothetical protein